MATLDAVYWRMDISPEHRPPTGTGVLSMIWHDVGAKAGRVGCSSRGKTTAVNFGDYELTIAEGVWWSQPSVMRFRLALAERN